MSCSLVSLLSNECLLFLDRDALASIQNGTDPIYCRITQEEKIPKQDGAWQLSLRTTNNLIHIDNEGR